MLGNVPGKAPYRGEAGMSSFAHHNYFAVLQDNDERPDNIEPKKIKWSPPKVGYLNTEAYAEAARSDDQHMRSMGVAMPAWTI